MRDVAQAGSREEGVTSAWYHAVHFVTAMAYSVAEPVAFFSSFHKYSYHSRSQVNDLYTQLNLLDPNSKNAWPFFAALHFPCDRALHIQLALDSHGHLSRPCCVATGSRDRKVRTNTRARVFVWAVFGMRCAALQEVARVDVRVRPRVYRYDVF